MSNSPSVGRPLLWLSLFLFLVAGIASTALAFEYLSGLKLPGCGPASTCSQLSSGPWGKIVGWPVSFIGSAWFAAMATALFVATMQGAPFDALRWAGRFGVVVSLGFIAIMAYENQWCRWCLAVHAANLLGWLVLELGSRNSSFRAATSTPTTSRNSLAAAAIVASGISIVLLLLDRSVHKLVAHDVEVALNTSVAKIVETATARVSAKSPSTQEQSHTSSFTGRYRRGPDTAALRIVAFSDYQCIDCQNLERQLSEILGTYSEVSYSHKHFPLCRECNALIKEPFHENACLAAFAAEAAGQVGREDAFWSMHDWLFTRKGKFREEELREALPEIGLGEEDFWTAYRSDLIRDRVIADVSEGASLGADSTPLVFVNGVEIKGAETDNGLIRAVDRLALEHLPPCNAANDTPRPAFDRLFARWLEGKSRPLLASATRWRRGPAVPRLELTLTVDYANPYVPAKYSVISAFAAEHPDVGIAILQAPISHDLNPSVKEGSHDFYGPATQMALLAEAVGRVAGADAFWKMHQWLLDHQVDFNRDAAFSFAESLGLDRNELIEAMDSEDTRAGIAADVNALKASEFNWTGRLLAADREVTARPPTAELLERIYTEATR